MLAKTPEPPYYAVIFTSIPGSDSSGYAEMAEKMLSLASKQPGFLGVETARGAIGISVSYWKDLPSIARWKANAEHRIAQKIGRDKWYASFKTRVALVEKETGMDTQKD